MSPMPDRAIPTDDEMRSLLGEVRGLAARLAHYTGVPDLDEARRTMSFHGQAGAVITTLARLATSRELRIPGVPIESMRAQLELAQRLQPLADEMAALLQCIDDTVLSAESDGWEAAATYYEALVRLGASDETLAAALRPIAQYFGDGGGGVYSAPAALAEASNG